MRTILVGRRVSDLGRSLAFYTSLGYRRLGQVALDDGARLVVLSFSDEPVATLELVHRPAERFVRGVGLDHLAVQVDDLDATRATLVDRGLTPSHVERPEAPTAPGRPGWRTPTVTGSSWCSGLPATPTASPRPTSPMMTAGEVRARRASGEDE